MTLAIAVVCLPAARALGAPAAISATAAAQGLGRAADVRPRSCGARARSAARAVSSSTPMAAQAVARAARSREAQAEPAEASTPRASRACRSGSAGRPGKAARRCAGARGRRVTVAAAASGARPSAARLQGVAQRRHRRGAPGRGRGAPARGAGRSPRRPGTFSVPERSPRSWPPPSHSGASARARSQPQRADALGAVQLVRGERERVGAQRRTSSAHQPDRLHGVDVEVRPRRRRPHRAGARDLGDRLHRPELVVHQHDRRRPRSRAAPPPAPPRRRRTPFAAGGTTSGRSRVPRRRGLGAAQDGRVLDGARPPCAARAPRAPRRGRRGRRPRSRRS